MAQMIRQNEKMEMKMTQMVPREEFNHLHNRMKEQSMSSLPMGTIVGWLPQPSDSSRTVDKIPPGWVQCDGDMIQNGPLHNLRTPDLNKVSSGLGMFLRGSTDALAGKMESLQVHTHEDLGHTHYDEGHTHKDSGHTHIDSGHSHSTQNYQVYNRTLDLGYQFGQYLSDSKESSGTYSASANIQSSSANIGDAVANIQVIIFLLIHRFDIKHLYLKSDFSILRM